MEKKLQGKTLGVFDSGLGGLTVLRQILRRGGFSRILYFGDTARMPYGGRSVAQLQRFAQQDAALLRNLGADSILVACGTIGAVALTQLQQTQPCPVQGILQPAAQYAAAQTRNGIVGVIGTQASIDSNAYLHALYACPQVKQVVQQACPLFVPILEYGLAQEEIVPLLCAQYLQPLRAAGVDTLILGCTHYPLLRAQIGEYMGAGVTLVDPGEAVAELLAPNAQDAPLPVLEGYISGDTTRFGEYAKRFANVEIEQIAHVSAETDENDSFRQR